MEMGKNGIKSRNGTGNRTMGVPERLLKHAHQAPGDVGSRSMTLNRESRI